MIYFATVLYCVGVVCENQSNQCIKFSVRFYIRLALIWCLVVVPVKGLFYCNIVETFLVCLCGLLF